MEQPLTASMAAKASRRVTRQVKVGGVAIGGDARVSVQSMCSTDTRDSRATLAQIDALARAGCEIIRVAVPDLDAAKSLGTIVRSSPLPVVADIHFDHRLAIEAIEAGVAKLRMNPGNIGGPGRVIEVARAAAERAIPIRVGANSGSIRKEHLSEFGYTARALVESALDNVAILEKAGFGDIVVSVKASSVLMTIEAYRLLSERCAYPLHLGVTEAGTAMTSAVRSALGVGTLLLDGIGDTIRVSVSGDPLPEIAIAREILRCAGIRRDLGPTVIACPTCGRTEADVAAMALAVENAVAGMNEPLTIAVMGCPVNGVGEGMHADLGMACGRDESLIFRKGKIVARVDNRNLLAAFLRELEKLTARGGVAE